jgi:hypothetical protein
VLVYEAESRAVPAENWKKQIVVMRLTEEQKAERLAVCIDVYV